MRRSMTLSFVRVTLLVRAVVSILPRSCKTRDVVAVTVLVEFSTVGGNAGSVSMTRCASQDTVRCMRGVVANTRRGTRAQSLDSPWRPEWERPLVDPLQVRRFAMFRLGYTVLEQL